MKFERHAGRVVSDKKEQKVHGIILYTEIRISGALPTTSLLFTNKFLFFMVHPFPETPPGYFFYICIRVVSWCL